MTISPAIVALDKQKAQELFKAYKTHVHYAKPIDHEIGRAYQLLAKGRLIIRAHDSIRAAGLNGNFPKLALARADWPQCFCQMYTDGSVSFSARQWLRGRDFRYSFPADTFVRAQSRRA